MTPLPIATAFRSSPVAEVLSIPLDQIAPDPDQPRVTFDTQKLGELAESMKNEGLLTPILLRRGEGVPWIIVTGERRYRAAQMLKWKTIPALEYTGDTSTTKILRQQLLENAVRVDLNPVEEATAYARLAYEGMTAWQIARAVGKDASTVTYVMNILRCEPQVLELVARRQVGVTVAWNMGRLSADGQMMLLRRFTSKRLDTQTMVAMCQTVYAQESQPEMFEETKLTEKQVQARKDLLAVLTSLSNASARLRSTVQGNSLSLPALAPDQVDEALQVLNLGLRDLSWLQRQLKADAALQAPLVGG